MRDGRRTRARIEEEAVRLFAGKGIAATSIRDIAQAAGIAEGALYRHFPSKDALARGLFLSRYADLAKEIRDSAAGLNGFPEVAAAVVRVFCDLFDRDRALFAFLLLSQHQHMADVPADAGGNVVETVHDLFREAVARGDLPAQDTNLATALALGIVAQPAVFTLYGRLEGPMQPRAEHLTAAVLAMAHAPR